MSIQQKIVKVLTSLVKQGAMNDNLFAAIEAKNAVELAKCIAAGANPNATNKARDSALIMATRNSFVEGVGILLDAGADISYENKKTRQDAFTLSIFLNEVEILRKILEKLESLGFGAKNGQ